MHQFNSDYWLTKALELARRRKGFCAPNPAVGAIVVKDGQKLAEGLHWGPFYDHAEKQALDQLDANTCSGAILYVTLEPCCFHGRTPACTELIINKGIRRVIYGYNDPNPKVAGEGAAQLINAGVHCEHVPLQAINEFYTSYAYWTDTGLPFVTSKLALTMDGKIARADGNPIPITGDQANAYTHQCRYESEAVLTTLQTVRSDNPRLNARLNGRTYEKPVYILDRDLDISPRAQIFNSASQVTLIHKPEVSQDDKARLLDDNKSVSFLSVSCNSGTGLDLAYIIYELGRAGVHDLWVEAGGRLNEALINQRLIQRSIFLVAPKWQGQDGRAAFTDSGLFQHAPDVQWSSKGADGLCRIEWRL